MSDHKPLIYTVAFLLIVGFVLPYFLGFFIDVDSIETSSLVSPLVDVIDYGFELDVIPIAGVGEFDVNPFSWLGSTMQSYISDSITYLGLLPNFLIIIIIVLSSISILYSIIKLLPTT